MKYDVIDCPHCRERIYLELTESMVVGVSKIEVKPKPASQSKEASERGEGRGD